MIVIIRLYGAMIVLSYYNTKEILPLEKASVG